METVEKIIEKIIQVGDSEAINLIPESESSLSQYTFDRMNYWSKKSPTMKVFFEAKLTKSLIKVCAITLNDKSNKFEILNDFISGLAFLPMSRILKDEDLETGVKKLMNSGIDSIMNYFKSEHWQKWLIEKEVTGQETMQVKDITIPITPEALLLHIKRTNKLILSTEQVILLEKEWRKYMRLKYQDDNSYILSGLHSQIEHSEVPRIFDSLLKIHFVQESDRNNFIAVFKKEFLPPNWAKVKWSGSRKECFSFMIDMCGNIEAQTINLYFTQNSINRLTKKINTKPLNPRDRSNCKPGFLSRLFSK